LEGEGVGEPEALLAAVGTGSDTGRGHERIVLLGACYDGTGLGYVGSSRR
jgi:hypothetical protein